MYIETKEIGPDGLVVDRDVPCRVAPLVEGEDRIAVERAHLTGEVHKEGRGYLFAGDLNAVATLLCSRCLESFTLPLDTHFDLTYTAESRPSTAGESRVDDESVTEVPFDGARIDLGALVDEQVNLALPLKPLCRQDCRGLCPHCGTNLNGQTCGCTETVVADPRLTALKKLL